MAEGFEIKYNHTRIPTKDRFEGEINLPHEQEGYGVTGLDYQEKFTERTQRQ